MSAQTHGLPWMLREKVSFVRSSVLSQCFFWLAQYGPNAAVPPNWPTWTLWQYTDGNASPQPHTVPGIGACDRDQFNGDLDGLKELWGVGP